VAEELDTYTPNGPASLVTPDGSAKPTSRRPGRELFPTSWLRHKAEVTYEGGRMSGTHRRRGLNRLCASSMRVSQRWRGLCAMRWTTASVGTPIGKCGQLRMGSPMPMWRRGGGARAGE
jgi:hypothetical protein